MAALAQPQIQLAPGGELTSEVYPSSSKPGAVDVLYVTEENGSVGITEDARRRQELPLRSRSHELKATASTTRRSPMANITQHLTSISLDSRSGVSSWPATPRADAGRDARPRQRLPRLRPGGREPTAKARGRCRRSKCRSIRASTPAAKKKRLEEAPAAGGEEEGGAVEVEAEVDLEVPPAGKSPAPPPKRRSKRRRRRRPTAPKPAALGARTRARAAAAPEAETSEPVANQSIVAPKQAAGAERSTASVGDGVRRSWFARRTGPPGGAAVLA